MTPDEKIVRDTLTMLFWKEGERNVLLGDAGIPPYKIDLTGSAVSAWHNIVMFAIQRHKLHDLVKEAVKHFPEDEVLSLAVNNKAIPKALAGFAPPSRVDPEELEKITARNSTILDIDFLSAGIEAARPVAKITSPECLGTGFLMEGNWLITNSHVIPDPDTARRSYAIFGFDSESASSNHCVSIKLDPDPGFFSSDPISGDDWSIIKLPCSMNDKFGALRLAADSPPVGDYVNIIQHPGGRAKKIALYHNTVYRTKSLSDGRQRIQYLTDTEPGSSGSPVFNSAWEVVALHHANSTPLDEKTRMPIVVNQGIPVSVLRADLPIFK